MHIFIPFYIMKEGDQVELQATKKDCFRLLNDVGLYIVNALRVDTDTDYW